MQEDDGAPRANDTVDQELAVIGRLVRALVGKFESIPSGWFLLLLSLSVLLRSGARHFKAFDPLLACIVDLPASGGDYRCQGIAIFGLPLLLGIKEKTGWIRLHDVLTCFALLSTLSLLWFRFGTDLRFRMSALWLSIGSMPVSLLHPREHYDVYMVAAGSWLALAPGYKTAFVAGLWLGAVNAEQALLAVLAYVAVALGLGLAREARVRAGALGVALGVALVKGYALVWLPERQSRLLILWQNLSKSLVRAADSGSVGIYAWYGLSWLLVAGWFLTARVASRERFLVLLGLVALPGLATFATLDGTRVFVCTSWPAFALFVATTVSPERQLQDRVPLRSLSALALLSLAVMPAYVTMKGGLSSPQLSALFRALW